jgi:hypothetical protein
MNGPLIKMSAHVSPLLFFARREHDNSSLIAPAAFYVMLNLNIGKQRRPFSARRERANIYWIRAHVKSNSDPQRGHPIIYAIVSTAAGQIQINAAAHADENTEQRLIIRKFINAATC